MKKFLMLFALTLSPAVLALTPPAPDSFKQPQIFSNWLLNRCAGKAASDKAFSDDAFKSASAWLEVSHLPVEAFSDGDKLINAYLKMNLSGSVKGSFNMMKCTLLSQSQDAQAIYKKHKK